MARRGFDILLVARSTSLLQENAEEIQSKFNVRCSFLTADLALPAAAQQVFDWCNGNNYPVTVLVNNAGFGTCGPFENAALEEQLEMMNVNMMIPVALSRLFIPLLGRQKRAYILNIGSTTAYQALPLMAVYAASKVFMLRLSRGLHEELRHSPISVTCVCPGTTDTDFPNRAKVPVGAIKKGEKVAMTPAAVAKIAVKGMLDGKKEVVPGFINKLMVFLVWLFPKKWTERIALKIYRQK